MSFIDSTKATSNAQKTTLPPARAQSSGLVNLPPEVIIRILGMLSIQQLGSLNQTCWQMSFVMRNNPLTLLLSEYFPNFRKRDPNQTDLEALYEQHVIESNLKKGVYASRTLEEHNGSVRGLALDQERLISCSSDNTIKIWDLKTNTCTSTLQGHDGPVFSLTLDGQRLFTSSSDGTIKIWDLNTKECTATLQGHEGPVFSIVLDGQKLFSSSLDNTIKIWDLNTKECTATLQGGAGPVYKIALDGQKLFSGCLNNTIMIWDLATNTSTVTLAGHTGAVHTVVCDGQRLFSGSNDNTIKIWDLNTNTSTATLQGHGGSVHSLAVVGQRLFSGSADSTVKVWDLNTYQCIDTFQDYNGRVFSLALDDQRVISGSNIITIRDTNVSDADVFNEIAGLLKSNDHSKTKEAMDRFSRMPPGAKNAIYGELYQIMPPFENPSPACAADAFHDLNGLNSTPEQKAQAILNYLAKRT
ncbi:MAG: F-box/WD repeat-containing protein [Verrucomicrobia bacterium]|nr:F-box/WD repeat-containing protein [Verrucomicrobiota bacterium]